MAIVIDGGDRACVVLLIELRARMSEMAPGTRVHLYATDPAAPLDLAAWCHLTGHVYHGPLPGPRPAYELEVAAAPAPTRPERPWHPM